MGWWQGLRPAESFGTLHGSEFDGGHGFSLLHDGIGFASNPRLGHSKPHADQATVVVHDGLTTTHVVMNYRSGLFSFAPIKR